MKGLTMTNKLVDKECVPCRGDAPKLDQEQIAHYLAGVPQWQMVETDGVNKIFRIFKFKNFAEALKFTDQVGELAEQAGHHPDILLQWGKVTVTWYSHKIGGLHENDFIMAARTDRLYEA